MEPLDIRAVAAEQAEDLRQTLVLAFSADPCTRYIWPNPRDFLACYPRMVRAIGGVDLDRGSGYATADFGAGALWLQPGRKPDSDAIDALIGETVSPERQAVAGQVGELMQAFHPDEPHWYLSMLGVDPARQGRGLGSALLRHTLAICDSEGLPAYLESSNPKNVPLYERFGFEVIGQIQPADFPGLTPMLRRPQRS
ncbi:MAG: GNAT family N-acetyltransferase [Phenylobacterium sp.]